jgi:hypothetical protein
VVLPPSSSLWVASQPTTLLSPVAAQKELLQSQHTISRPEVIDHPVHVHFIETQWGSQDAVDKNFGDLSEELMAAVDSAWGLGKQKKTSKTQDSEDDDEEEELEDKDGWRTVVLYESLAKIMARANGRILVGEPLCELGGCLAFAFEYPLTG